MCKAKADGGGRCEYADLIANVRRKARYKHRNDYDANRKAEDAVREWQAANPDLVRAHLPTKMPFNYTPSTVPIPKSLLALLTPSSRVPVTGASSEEERKLQVAERHQEYVQWREKLTDDERNAIDNYKMTGFELMNATLRKKGVSRIIRQDYAFSSAEQQAAVKDRASNRVKHLKRALRKTVSKNEVRKVYRFFRVPSGVTPTEYVERYLSKGKGFSDPAFLSTSADPEFLMAHIWDRNNGSKNHGYIVMEILTGQGQSLQGQPTTEAGIVQSLENEVLLPAGTKLRVAGFNPSQRFEFGVDRPDLSEHYGLFRPYAKGKNTHVKGARANYPLVQLIDERLLPKG